MLLVQAFSKHAKYAIIAHVIIFLKPLSVLNLGKMDQLLGRCRVEGFAFCLITHVNILAIHGSKFIELVTPVLVEKTETRLYPVPIWSKDFHNAKGV